MATCRVCRIVKDDQEFAKKKTRKDGSILRNTICKLCQKVVSKNHYTENKIDYIERNRIKKKKLINFINEYKSQRNCERCGFLGKDNPSSLDFHHIKKEDKKCNVSQLFTYSEKKILQEIAKCKLLCGNCHRIVEHEERIEKNPPAKDRTWNVATV
jgi:uncharacterized coiled-coil DUF342 family protein